MSGGIKIKECAACAQGFAENNDPVGRPIPCLSCQNGVHDGPFIRLCVNYTAIIRSFGTIVRECVACAQGFDDSNDPVGHPIPCRSCLNEVHDGPFIRLGMNYVLLRFIHIVIFMNCS
jgi:hypothetical protein